MPTKYKTHRPLGALSEPQRKNIVDRYRGSRHERGYDSRWDKARLTYLRHHPLCVHCERDGRTEAATVVDHIIPHRGDKKMFWDKTNWQPLCKRHHDVKTASEDGGFGNRHQSSGDER